MAKSEDEVRHERALLSVIHLASDAVQARTMLTPESVLDAIGFEIQIDLCFGQRWIVGVDPAQAELFHLAKIEDGGELRLVKRIEVVERHANGWATIDEERPKP